MIVEDIIQDFEEFTTRLDKIIDEDIDDPNMQRLLIPMKNWVREIQIMKQEKEEKRMVIREEIEDEIDDSQHLKRLPAILKLQGYFELDDSVKLSLRSQLNKCLDTIISVLLLYNRYEDLSYQQKMGVKIDEEQKEFSGLGEDEQLKKDVSELIAEFENAKKLETEEKFNNQMEIKEKLKKLPKQKKVREWFNKFTGDVL